MTHIVRTSPFMENIWQFSTDGPSGQGGSLNRRR